MIFIRLLTVLVFVALAGIAPQTYLAARAAVPAVSVPVSGSTPAVVSTGRAQLIAPLALTQQLRAVIALRPPHQAEEEQFLTDLQTKGSPEFHHFLSADEWNSRFASSFSVCAGLLQAAFWLNFPISD